MGILFNYPTTRPSNYMTKRIFISADHGTSVIYFLQSDVVPTLLDAGVEVILLTDEAIVTQLATRSHF